MQGEWKGPEWVPLLDAMVCGGILEKWQGSPETGFRLFWNPAFLEGRGGKLALQTVAAVLAALPDLTMEELKDVCGFADDEDQSPPPYTRGHGLRE